MEREQGTEAMNLSSQSTRSSPKSESVFLARQCCVFALSFLLGYRCEPYNNPADFFLDVINGDSSAVTLNRSEEDCEGM